MLYEAEIQAKLEKLIDEIEGSSPGYNECNTILLCALRFALTDYKKRYDDLSNADGGGGDE